MPRDARGVCVGCIDHVGCVGVDLWVSLGGDLVSTPWQLTSALSLSCRFPVPRSSGALAAGVEGRKAASDGRSGAPQWLELVRYGSMRGKG